MVFQKLLKCQNHNYLFYSLDRLVHLLQVSINYQAIYYSLFCLTEYFRDLENNYQYSQESEYKNELILKLFYYTYFCSEHQNLFNPKHVEFIDYFYDDPKYKEEK